MSDFKIQRMLEKGLATQAQVDEATEISSKLTEMGMQARSVAEVLCEKGIITSEQLEDLRREERRSEGREQIAGYRLDQKLGEGAMGSVYKARQLSLDRDVAIKVLAPHLSEDDSYVKRFVTEAKAVARLNHTNIISGIDVGEAGGVKYLVMEYADGQTVASLLTRGGSMDEERVLGIGLMMARALDHAHRNNLVHRDVKPDNIILTKDGVAKLCDLGLAKMETHEGDEPARMGTAAYISPEQARGEHDLTERADLYSLGCTLFHMLTGREPFEGADASAVLAMHLTEPAPSVRTFDGSVSERTDLLVQTLMAKDASDRIGSAKELIGILEDAVKELKAARGKAAPVGAPAARSKPASSAAPKGSDAPSGPAPLRRRRRRR
ncbi:MAG: serine/threonine-protein kinase [Planctomycetota bacterium]|nr:serine/threonine-protein kinase [Planctomycetota bacterium]